MKKEMDLQTLYRSLEMLTENFFKVENCLYQWALKRFNQNDRELFYDITSSYFIGRKCIIAEFGYSRDKRRDQEQVVIGLVTTSDGFPIKCNIYSGKNQIRRRFQRLLQTLSKDTLLKRLSLWGTGGC
ncbi:transposase [Evansella vedderi]|uniref:Transposase n=1 Tax=Evansella vedderi TaxID=38282 RepID=A0ABT9ZVR1_9BACI|nr:hypothetical protein [Evansella vedderi]MDQ0255322.1 transposase [Evansella vedderi]